MDERFAYGGVAMRVLLHGLADDVGDLVVAAVVHFAHGVQNTALYRLETVFDGRHGALEDDVRGIV